MEYKKEKSCNSNPHEGRYANYFEVGHNAVEFIVDFGQLYDESLDAKIHTRIVTSPLYAKALIEVLQESLSQFDEYLRSAEIEEEQQSSAKAQAKNQRRPRAAKCVSLKTRKSIRLLRPGHWAIC